MPKNILRYSVFKSVGFEPHSRNFHSEKMEKCRHDLMISTCNIYTDIAYSVLRFKDY